MIENDAKELLKYQQHLNKRMARGGDLIALAKHLKPDYNDEWFHRRIAKKLTTFLQDPNSKCLGIFVPPQHGKSELTTRLFPALALGLNPNLRMAVCSYSSDLASSFNRSIQKYIDSEEYFDVFPKTQINSKRVVTTSSWLRNNSEFEIIGYSGSLKSVGVGGGLSGKAIDLGIIDDPIKDMMEATSSTVKQRIWEWYLSVFSTRLHNDSKQVLIMTRWAEDDLAGRLLDPKQNPNYEDWETIKLEAIKEDDDIIEPREHGAALWEGRHSLDKLTKLRSLDPSIFESLYQQSPNSKEGSTIKRDWFKVIDRPPNYFIEKDLWIDTSYTEKKHNDPNGFITAGYDRSTNTVYIFDAESVRLEMPKFLNKVKTLKSKHSLGHSSRVMIEPKASGLSSIQLINKIPELGVSAVPIKSYLVGRDKVDKLSISSTYIESAKLVLIKGEWNNEYIEQMIKEKPKHDEYRDLTGYICEYYFRAERDVFGGGVSMSNLI